MARFLSIEGFAVVRLSEMRSIVYLAVSPFDEKLGETCFCRTTLCPRWEEGISRGNFFNEAEFVEEEAMEVCARILRQKLVEAAFRRGYF